MASINDAGPDQARISQTQANDTTDIGIGVKSLAVGFSQLWG